MHAILGLDFCACMLSAAGYLQTEWIMVDSSLIFPTFLQNLLGIIVLETSTPL